PPPANEGSLCCEPGCDRTSAAFDARCVLHASRLGPLPRELFREAAAADVEPEAAREPAAIALAEPEDPKRWGALVGQTFVGIGLTWFSAMMTLLFVSVVRSDVAAWLGFGGILASAARSAWCGWQQLKHAPAGWPVAAGVLLLFFAATPAVFLALLASLFVYAIL
ncbi:MAG: hypothetical protein ACK4N5_17675, partial [Myxococcales bacterium]